MKAFLLLCCVLFQSIGLATGDLPKESRVPGGVVILDISPADAKPPQVQFDGHPVMVVKRDSRWVAVIGLPLSLSPGVYGVDVNQQTHAVQFTVSDKHYPTQPLNVEPKYVEPPAEVLARIQRESALMRDAFAQFSEPLPDTFRMNLPAVGPETSAFGLRRVFNGQSRNPHSGVDIGAPMHAEVSAPLAGTVVISGDFYFNGNTIIVDHGGGLLSLYCHLSQINVEKGDRVSTGQLLGKVGATGRVTGPHLHFSVNLTGARVDPTLFFTQETGK